MSDPRNRTALVGVLVALQSVVLDARARAESGTDTPLSASMQCDRALEPGRVRCSLEARAVPGRAILWADVVLVDMPDFTTVLKGRFGPEDVVSREPGLQRWAFGAVARKAGEGEARARVRAVVCAAIGDAGATSCVATTVDVRAIVRVG